MNKRGDYVLEKEWKKCESISMNILFENNFTGAGTKNFFRLLSISPLVYLSPHM
jgi:hypothetical protein